MAIYHQLRLLCSGLQVLLFCLETWTNAEEPLFILLLSMFPANFSRAPGSLHGTQPKSAPAISRDHAAPVARPVPSSKSQKSEEEHPRLFWILPTYTVADSKSARPLTPHGKLRLFVKDKTDPFTIGSVAFEAGSRRRTMSCPDMARALPGTESDSVPDWLMKRQPGSLEPFCFLRSCIKIHAIIDWAPGLSKNASDMH